MVDYYQTAIDAATQYGLDPTLFLAQINQESGFNPTAVSSAGATGIAQFMPETAAALNLNPLDPESSLYAAAKLMASYLKQFGNYALALSAYNAGPGAVQQYGGVPPYPETQQYVRSIFAQAGQEAPVTNYYGPPKYPTAPTILRMAGEREAAAAAEKIAGIVPGTTTVRPPNPFPVGTFQWMLYNAGAVPLNPKDPGGVWGGLDEGDQPWQFDLRQAGQAARIEIGSGGEVISFAADGTPTQMGTVPSLAKAAQQLAPEQRLLLQLQGAQLAQQIGMTGAGLGSLQPVAGGLFDPLTRTIIDPSTLGLSRAQFDEMRRQFDTTFGEGQRQFDLGFGENQRQFNVGETGTNARALLNAGLQGFQSVNQLAPQLGQLALENARYTSDLTQTPADYLARAFAQRGGESPLPVVTQADLINNLRSNIGNFNNVLGGFNVNPLNNPQMSNPYAGLATRAPGGVPPGSPVPLAAPVRPAPVAGQATPSGFAVNPDFQAQIGSYPQFADLVAQQIEASGEDYNAPAVAEALFNANEYDQPYGAVLTQNDPNIAGWGATEGINEINAAMGIPGYAQGTLGATRAPAFITGDAPSGRPTGFEEMVVNPTRAPISVIPNRMQRPKSFGSFPEGMPQANSNAAFNRTAPPGMRGMALPTQAAPQAQAQLAQRQPVTTSIPQQPPQEWAVAPEVRRPPLPDVMRPAPVPPYGGEMIQPIPEGWSFPEPRMSFYNPDWDPTRIGEIPAYSRGTIIPRYAEGTTYWSSDFPGQSSSAPWPGQSSVDAAGTVAGTPASTAVTNDTSTPGSFYTIPQSTGMNFAAPQLPVPPPVTQPELIDLARRFSPPAVSDVVGGRMPATLRFGFPLPSPQMLSTLTPAERLALNTRLATEFNTTVEDVEHAVRQRFTNPRQRPRARMAVGV